MAAKPKAKDGYIVQKFRAVKPTKSLPVRKRNRTPRKPLRGQGRP